jgi:hypothetical protein
MVKKKHKTPEHLDHLFLRNVIDKKQYGDFWSGYWEGKRQTEKDRFVDKFIKKLQMELPLGKKKPGNVTISRLAAQEQADEIGGYVVRRNAKGKFSKTGQYYQAIAPRRKK